MVLRIRKFIIRKTAKFLMNFVVDTYYNPRHARRK